MEVVETIDLHVHSTASDGTLSPGDVVRLAKESGVRALALTDHDTVDGVAAAREEGRRVGVEVVNGIEVSCAFPRPGTMHLLGYGFEIAHPAMQRLLAIIGSARAERAGLIVGRLRRLGMEMTVEEVKEETGGVGRPHLAKMMVKKGYVLTRNEAFRKYLGGAGAAWVDHLPLMSDRVIPMIREAGGVVSLAHPFQLRRETFAQLEAVVRELAEQGMEAIETIHGSHDTDMVHRLTRLADRVGLLTSGESDFHSLERGNKLGRAGERGVPHYFLEQIMEGWRAWRRRAPAGAKTRSECGGHLANAAVARASSPT